uniref:tRNA (guanine-N(7)-)-methyltransferase non-catalytic subunit n=1 Tax=Ascaris lumbricoides TaxID=6252 RepID=A0A0M3HYG0_ASCLU
MARVHCNDDRLVITAKTEVVIFTFEVNDVKLNLKKQQVLNVDVAVDEIPQLPDVVSELLPTANTLEDSQKILKCDKKNGSGARKRCKNTTNVGDDKSANENRLVETDKQILGSAFSRDGSLFAVVTSMKTCLVYDTRQEWKQRRRPFRIPKAPTAVTFDADTSHLIVADRAGNVCRYTLDECANRTTNVHVDINGEQSRYEGDPLVGHVSMVLDVSLSEDGRFVLSADRDEKLRISRYPQSFVIHRFCLGHTSYINSLCVDGHFAFTSGGDGTIRVWDIETGAALSTCDHFAKKPIRCMRKYSSPKAEPKEKMMLAVVPKECDSVTLMLYDSSSSSFAVMCELKVPQNVVDVAFCDRDHIVAITNSSILFGEIKADGKLDVVEGVDGSLIESLQAAHDGLPPLEKKVGFNNVGEYQQRKNERIQSRKRKAQDAL